MLPLSLVARFFFRRQSDAAGVAVAEDGKTFAPSLNVTRCEDTNEQNNTQQNMQYIDNGNIQKTESV
jgi:hypothetical protein